MRQIPRAAPGLVRLRLGCFASLQDRVCLPAATISQSASQRCVLLRFAPRKAKSPLWSPPLVLQFIHSLQSVHFKRSRRFNDTRNSLRPANLPICHRKVKPHRELPNSGWTAKPHEEQEQEEEEELALSRRSSFIRFGECDFALIVTFTINLQKGFRRRRRRRVACTRRKMGCRRAANVLEQQRGE